MKTHTSTLEINNTKKAYNKPELKNPGTLAELTQGFAGSIPDEQEIGRAHV